ncbi:hypothetical protein DFP72DRAFT_525601 [Ephemerocybe angulata]|uniref:Uncharacterized protein n=1 Tax=Ephemerocybe angulata TaxID=980116 RepID=A0A8H6IF46_9AGAR|nr:hypothetical protein DFP72DRAFT_525601 [Tulosesus angulatus]
METIRQFGDKIRKRRGNTIDAAEKVRRDKKVLRRSRSLPFRDSTETVYSSDLEWILYYPTVPQKPKAHPKNCDCACCDGTLAQFPAPPSERPVPRRPTTRPEDLLPTIEACDPILSYEQCKERQEKRDREAEKLRLEKTREEAELLKAYERAAEEQLCLLEITQTIDWYRKERDARWRTGDTRIIDVTRRQYRILWDHSHLFRRGHPPPDGLDVPLTPLHPAFPQQNTPAQSFDASLVLSADSGAKKRRVINSKISFTKIAAGRPIMVSGLNQPESDEVSSNSCDEHGTRSLKHQGRRNLQGFPAASTLGGTSKERRREKKLNRPLPALPVDEPPFQSSWGGSYKPTADETRHRRGTGGPSLAVPPSSSTGATPPSILNRRGQQPRPAHVRSTSAPATHILGVAMSQSLSSRQKESSYKSSPLSTSSPSGMLPLTPRTRPSASTPAYKALAPTPLKGPAPRKRNIQLEEPISEGLQRRRLASSASARMQSCIQGPYASRI